MATIEEGMSLSKFIVERINDCLKKWDSKYPLQLEEMALDDGRTRFYLWVPYEKHTELDHLMKTGGSYIQELTRKAIRQQLKMHRKRIPRGLPRGYRANYNKKILPYIWKIPRGLPRGASINPRLSHFIALLI